MDEIKYKPEFLELVNDLTQVTNQIVIQKTDTEVYILRQDSEKIVNYTLKAPREYFDFPMEDMSFYNFNEFYKFFKIFNNPKMFADSNMIYMSDDSSRIEYLLSDKNTLFRHCEGKDYNIPNPDIRVKLSKQDLDTLVKMTGSFQAKRMRIMGDENELYIKIVTEEQSRSNTFNMKFDFENLSGFTGEFDFMIRAEFLEKQLPKKRPYELDILNKGFVRAHMVSDKPELNLNLYTAHIVGKNRGA